MTLRKFSAWLALGFGPLLLLQTAIRHWGAWNGWVVADLAAAALLGLGGARVLKTDGDVASRWLAGGWGFACATLWVSLFTLIPDMSAEMDPHEGEGTYLVMAGWLLITAMSGFAASLGRNQNARPGPGA